MRSDIGVPEPGSAVIWLLQRAQRGRGDRPVDSRLGRRAGALPADGLALVGERDGGGDVESGGDELHAGDHRAATVPGCGNLGRLRVLDQLYAVGVDAES